MLFPVTIEHTEELEYVYETSAYCVCFSPLGRCGLDALSAVIFDRRFGVVHLCIGRF